MKSIRTFSMSETSVPIKSIGEIKRRMSCLSCMIALLGMVVLVTLTYFIVWSRLALDQLLKSNEIVAHHMEEVRARTNDSWAKVDEIYTRVGQSENMLLKIVPCPSGYFRIRGQSCRKGDTQ